MNVKECPLCNKYNTKYSILGPKAHGNNTEIKLAAYCPDCGYSWYIIYSPDYTIER